MRLVLVLPALVALAWACRRDAGEEDLKWSCARVEASGNATATPECIAQLKQTNSPVLKFYKLIPHAGIGGKIEQYSLVAKDERAPSSVR